MVLESHEVFQRQLFEAAAICIFIGVFDDLHGYSSIYSTGVAGGPSQKGVWKSTGLW